MIDIEIFRSKHPDQLKRTFNKWQEDNPEREIKQIDMTLDGEQIGLLVQHKPSLSAVAGQEYDLGPLPSWVTDDSKTGEAVE